MTLLKLRVIVIPCKRSGLTITTLRLVHIVPHQSHASLSVCSVQYLNYLVSQFELSIFVFGHCRYQHWGQVFLYSKGFCCNDELIPQSHKLVEICFSHCKVSDQSEHFVVIFLKNFEYFIQVV